MKLSRLTFAAIAGAGILSLASCSNSGQQAGGQQQAPAIATMVVQNQNSELTSTYPATIKGKTDIQIRPQVTGFITNVCVDEGQIVRKGQTLFIIDQVQYQAAVDQAVASVNVAKTALETAELTARNKQQLFQKNIISEYENQIAQNNLATAKAQLAQANSALVNAKKNLSYTVVTAPSDGVVGSIPSREGSLASPSMAQPLTTVSNTGDVYAYFALTEKEILSLTDNGQISLNKAIAAMPEVELRLADGTIYPYKGKVSTVSGVIDGTTGSSTVRAIFKNPEGVLRSGATGQVLIPTLFENVILIPQKATSELQDRRFAYVVNDSNMVHSVPVTVAELNDGKNFVITSGLNPGDRIAIEGVGTAVRDGVVITPTEPAAAENQQAAETPAE